MLAQGSLYMIGENSDGRLGISKRSLKSCTVPVLVQAFSKYSKFLFLFNRHIVYRVSCGSNHTAAIIGSYSSAYFNKQILENYLPGALALMDSSVWGINYLNMPLN